MARKIKTKQAVYTGGAILLLIFLAATLLNYSKTHPVAISAIENIDGIPFPTNKDTIITEKLAHADIYIENSPFARALKITTTFKPLNTTSLFVGIRENSFWLSYPKHQICCSQEQVDRGNTATTTTVTIPITDKLLDTNDSLDLMYFSANADSSNKEDEGIYDKTLWVLEDIQIISSPATPTRLQIKDYIISKLTFERPL